MYHTKYLSVVYQLSFLLRVLQFELFLSVKNKYLSWLNALYFIKKPSIFHQIPTVLLKMKCDSNFFCLISLDFTWDLAHVNHFQSSTLLCCTFEPKCSDFRTMTGLKPALCYLKYLVTGSIINHLDS